MLTATIDNIAVKQRGRDGFARSSKAIRPRRALAAPLTQGCPNERNPAFLLRVIPQLQKEARGRIGGKSRLFEGPPFREVVDLRILLLQEKGHASRRREEGVQVVAERLPPSARHSFPEVFRLNKSLLDQQEADKAGYTLEVAGQSLALLMVERSLDIIWDIRCHPIPPNFRPPPVSCSPTVPFFAKRFKHLV